jgi:hypothetical protein
MISFERIKEIKELYEQQVILFFLFFFIKLIYKYRIKMFQLYGVEILMQMKHH